MAFSGYSGLGAKTITRWIVAAVVLFTCASPHAQDLKSYILATRRGGVIEIIDPASLASRWPDPFRSPFRSAALMPFPRVRTARSFTWEGQFQTILTVVARSTPSILRRRQRGRWRELPGTALARSLCQFRWHHLSRRYAGRCRGDQRHDALGSDAPLSRWSLDFRRDSLFGRGTRRLRCRAQGSFLRYIMSGQASATNVVAQRHLDATIASSSTQRRRMVRTPAVVGSPRDHRTRRGRCRRAVRQDSRLLLICWCGTRCSTRRNLFLYERFGWN